MCVFTQRLGQAALGGVGRGRRRATRGGGPDIGVIDASSQSTAKGAGQHRGLRFKSDERIGPCRIYLRFRQRRNAGPICTAEAPSVRAAAITGTESMSSMGGPGQTIPRLAVRPRLGRRRRDGRQPRSLARRSRPPRRLSADRLGGGRRGGKPGNPARLEGGDKFRRKEPHDRGDGAGSRRKQRRALRLEVGQARIAGLRSNLGAPLRYETPDFPLGLRIAHGRRIRNQRLS
jgi:hypothetical protein